MIELQTPSEILDTLVENIEKQRIRKKIKQSELCKIATVPLSTYQTLLYKKKISIVSLIKIMYSLEMWDNLQGMIEYQEVSSIEEMKRMHKKSKLPQRVKDKK
jgi:predicted transcriptional regulator